ncbi:urease subunit gamma [Streptomyces iconiensis]|uniref:urease n=1 Tax=Streptomyces iconiensis TaxID=1384038 RepID=A0ABT6ZRI8_9ACTN|nr:urease subunit gamma [Streptomyces iconiensis]MDJ1131128.1 urease subunit gamma [Streptomyces iconiensis]
MHLTPHEQERLLIHVAADVARQRHQRGLRLNYPEVMALLTAYVYEQARAGATVDSVMETGRHVLKRGDVMDGVPEMIDTVQVEATFPDGTKLVTIRDPFEKLAEDEVDVYPGKVDLLADPKGDQDKDKPGGQQDAKDCTRQSHKASQSGGPAYQYTVPYNAGERVTRICVKNPNDRPIQVGSHFHFYETNGYAEAAADPAADPAAGSGAARPGLDFNPADAYGKRLNIPSGSSERFEPGDERWVELVPIQGLKQVKGLQIKDEADRQIDGNKVTTGNGGSVR